MNVKRFWPYVIFIPSYLFLATVFLLQEPRIWSDEAVYMDIAKNLAETGVLGTDLWQGMIPHVETKALWNPPLFFYMVSWWLRVTDFTIEFQRLLSVFAGLGVVILTYELSQFWLHKVPTKKLLGLICVLLVSSDFLFLRAARLSRPEIFVLLFCLLGIYLLLQAPRSSPSQSKQLFLVAGLSFGLALLIHPLALLFQVFFVLYWWWGKVKFAYTQMSLFFLCSLGPLLMWLLSVWSDWSILIEQMQLASVRKSYEALWLLLPLKTQTPELFVIFGVLQAVLFLSLVSWKKTSASEIRLLFSLLIVGWLIAWFGRMFHYAVYFIPFTYLVLVVNCQLGPKAFRSIWRTLGILLLLGNGFLFVNTSHTLTKNPLDYHKFSMALRSVVPKESAVFLSAAPDPYFALHDYPILRQFPVLPLSDQAYTAILDQMDVVIYSGNFNQVLFPDLLENYLQTHSNSYQTIEAGGYSAVVFYLD